MEQLTVLSSLEKRVISAIQEDLPIVREPYKCIAAKLGISETVLLNTMKSLCERGVIRRFGATLRHQKTGFQANAMTAWNVPDDKVDDVGKTMSQSPQISHCYVRPRVSGWPYNLYTMIHAKDLKSCKNIAREISRQTGVKDYTQLFSKKELKKTSMRYFTPDTPDSE